MKLVLEGGQIPKGTITVSGAKNSATRILAASVLTDDKVYLDNFPTHIIDANVKKDFLNKIGANISFHDDENLAIIEGKNIKSPELDNYNYPIRTTYLLAASQIQRHGIARIPYPGGCKIGERKYDLHIMVWEKFGCKVFEYEDFIEIKCNTGFIANEITFPFFTIGGTENAMMCAAISKGTSIINNAYLSPEVKDLMGFLNSMGANIQNVGNTKLVIEGKNDLRGTSYKIMPDRIEALTWIVYGLLSKGNIVINNIPFKSMEVPLYHLKDAGIDLFSNSNSIYVSKYCLETELLTPFEMATGTHPGVISDMQPFFILIALKAQGNSRIIDYRYPNRTKYLDELKKIINKIDAISYDNLGNIYIIGPVNFLSAELNSTDLRGSMTAILAALLGKGKSQVNNVELALRGYNDLLGKLKSLGIIFQVIDD